MAFSEHEVALRLFAVLFSLAIFHVLPSLLAVSHDVAGQKISSKQKEGLTENLRSDRDSHPRDSSFPTKPVSNAQAGFEGGRPALLAGIRGFQSAEGPSPFQAEEDFTGKYAFSLLDEDIESLLQQRRVGTTEPDWKGITRDTGFFLLYQPVVLGVFYFLPEDFIGYSSDQKKISANKYWRQVRDPRFDRDSFWINFIAHPYWGSTFYTRARERGFDRIESFGYSVLLSTMFEFLSEAWYEPPSYNDLMVTPVLGSLIGAFITEPLRDYVKSKPEMRWYDHAALILTDPLGTANAFMEELLGIESSIRVYYRPATATRAAAKPQDSQTRWISGPRLGLEYTAQW